MTYTKTFNPERYSEIREILSQVEGLASGERLTIRNLGESLTRTRGLVYDWLFHMSLKPRFRVFVREETLVILRRGLPEGVTVEKEQVPSQGRLDEILRQMILSEPEETLQRALEDGRISLEEKGHLEERFKKIMS